MYKEVRCERDGGGVMKGTKLIALAAEHTIEPRELIRHTLNIGAREQA